MDMSGNEAAPGGEFTGLGDLSPPDGAVRPRRRVGRGTGSARGKTSTRGHKGQKSRSGYSRKVGFEGGQMPLQRRLPKRGFNNRFKKEFSELNVGRLGALAESATVDAATLRAAGLVRKVARDGVKLLGSGEVDRALHLKVQKCSASARRKIEGAGGSVEIAPLPSNLEAREGESA